MSHSIQQPASSIQQPASSIQQPASARRARHSRPAFTLVELLTVIIIIGLLMGLLLTAIGRTRVTALDSRDVAEMAQLDAALKKFKADFGALPPALHNDNTTANEAKVRAFWRRVWPRWDNANATKPPGADVIDLSPAEVLVFYLGGMETSTSKVNGFSLNPANPTDTTSTQRTKKLFDFDQSRLHDRFLADGTPGTNSQYEYYPPGSDTPYVYFDFTTYASLTFSPSGYGTAVPYFDQHSPSSSNYMNPDSFQIISAGRDFQFGSSSTSRIFPGGSGYTNDDNDNLTNFTTKRLEESKP